MASESITNSGTSQNRKKAIKSFFESIPESEGRCEWDKKVKWLGVRFNKTCTSFVFRCQRKKKTWWITLGSVESMTVESARNLALRMARLVRGDRDPRILIETLQLEVPTTLKQLRDTYLDYSHEHKKSCKNDKQRMIYLEPLMNRTLLSISPKDVEDLHKNIRRGIRERAIAAGKIITELTGNQTANMVIEQLRHMFNKAVKWGYVPFGTQNPAQAFDKYKTFPSSEFITDQQMPKVLEVLNHYPDRQAATVITFALLTGMRSNEVLNLKWSEIDQASKVITLEGRKTKSGRPLIQPITESLSALINTIPRTESDLVFPGRFRGSRRYHVDNEWRVIRKLAGVPNVRFHDLRRTTGSWLVKQTGSLALVGEVLNQTNQHVTKTYSLYAKNHIHDELQTYHSNLKAMGLKIGEEDGQS